ncbi:MAG: BrnT family toxin [Thermodesulfobacteriota bacterium]
MDYEWDARKAQHNLKKHGVDFADAVSVFDDLNTITIEDACEQEQRFVSIGIDCFARILVVVYTWRGDTIRIISARKATRKEQKHYEVGL